MKPKQPIMSFAGGRNTKITPVHGEPNESPDVQNVVYDSFGTIMTRNGYVHAGSAGTAVQRISVYNGPSGNWLMGFTRDGMFRYDGSNVTSVTGVISYPTNMWSTQFQNILFFNNGYQQPYKYNGAEVTYWGVQRPTLACTAATAVEMPNPSTLDGAYKWVQFGSNSYAVKGDYGPESNEISGTSLVQRIYLRTFASATGIDTIWIARNTAAASGVYFILTSVTNGTEYFFDNGSPALGLDDLSLVEYAPVDNAPPPMMDIFVPFMGRLFGANTVASTTNSRLYYSEIDDPEIYRVEDYIEIGQGDGYHITAISSIMNGIVIAKNDDNGGAGAMYLLYMPNAVSANWTLTRIDTDYGASAKKSMARYMDRATYFNKYGLWDISEQGGKVQMLPMSYKIEPDIYALGQASLNRAACCTYKNKVWLSVPEGTSQATNNVVYQYDYLSGGIWSKFTEISANDYAVYKGDLYGCNANGIQKLDTGTVDGAAAISSYYRTMPLYGRPEHRDNVKDWRWAWVTVECSGSWNMQLTYSQDFNIDSGYAVDVSLVSGGSEWSIAEWGKGIWGRGQYRKKVKITFRNVTSKSVDIKFSTTVANQYWKVHDIELFYNLKGIREI